MIKNGMKIWKNGWKLKKIILTLWWNFLETTKNTLKFVQNFELDENMNSGRLKNFKIKL